MSQGECSPYGVPKWLLKLKPGKYIIYQVCQITGASHTNVFIRFQALKVKFKKYEADNRLNIYEWPGAKYYLIKKYKDELKGLNTKRRIKNG
jgi:hypothetical protein